jgi:hypothetical protein
MAKSASEATKQCAACRADLTETGHDPDCQNAPLSAAELKRALRNRLGKPRKTETRDPDTGRVVYDAYEVTVEENLGTVLESRWLTGAVTFLLAELAALVTTCAAVKSSDPNKVGGKSANAAGPPVTPVWAEKKLDEIDRQLTEHAEVVAGWLSKPSDPDSIKGPCRSCGFYGEGDVYCRICGSPTLRAFLRCGVPDCGELRRDCGHTYADVKAAVG